MRPRGVRIVEEARREPREVARPAGAVPHPWSSGRGVPALYLPADVAAAAEARARDSAAQGREALALLFGDRFIDPEGTAFAVAGALASAPLDATRVHVRFSATRFAELAGQIDRLPFEHVIVGWFHTHLGIGAGLSPTDIATQKRYFSAAHQVTWVVDPERRESGAYRLGARGPERVEVATLGLKASALSGFFVPKGAPSPRTRGANTSR